MGQSMAILLEQGFGAVVPPWTQLSAPEPYDLAEVDETAATFYPTVYSPWLSEAEKDLLMIADSSLNVFALCEEFADGAFAGPIFRGWFVALVHAVSTINSVLARHNDPSTVVPTAVSEALIDNDLLWLSDQRALRNRAMHYGVPSGLSGVTGTLPMYGLVEATCHEPFHDVKTRLRDASLRLSNALSVWRERP
jgi:hypothetical protein